MIGLRKSSKFRRVVTIGCCSKLMMSLLGVNDEARKWSVESIRRNLFLCIKGLGYQEARLANICSCVAGAHCDEVDENPEASRQQAVAHQFRV